MSGPLKVVVGFVEIFLLDFNLGYFIEGGALQKLISSQSHHLLEVEDCVVVVFSFLKGFCFVKVGLAYHCWSLVLLFSELSQFVEILQCLF